MNRDCNRCGASDWTEVLSSDYPERRRERSRTIKTVYECNNCGAEGRHFENQQTGTEQFSSALR